MDKDAAAKISDEYLIKAIDQWIYWNETGDREGFYRYMREMGYIKEPYKVNQAYAWVLDETLDFENADKWATADVHPSYKYSYGYSRGSYSASTTYEGDDKDRSGTLGLKAVFTGMPEIIYPDKPVSLNLSFTTTTNSVVRLSFSGTASADFDQWDVGAGAVTRGAQYFANADGKETFTIDVNGNPSSYSEKLTATLGSGREGSRTALRTRFSFGVAMGTNYVYEWKQLD